ncbi:MAG: UDP-2,3-diacylglucosamine diphosphatase LpxI [Elusimicrobia bacterium]|nr:UDP-2,3-diacylglucosamine diphosphatase LpxI [Elusimicrobiota bacterium]
MDKKIGLIAGGGDFPLMFAKEAKNLGYGVFTVGFTGITSREIERYSESTAYFKLGQVSAPIDFFKRAGVTKALMAGKARHVSIFGGITADLRAARILLALKDKKAGSILGALVEELNKDGIEIINSTTFLERLLPAPGLLAGAKPDKNTLKSIEVGWKAAKALADLDIGLTVVVRDRAVIAVEAMEGTDECIKRAGEILRGRGVSGSGPLADLAVVKVARSRQDMRFDLPVVGLNTLESMKEARAGTLAIEAKKTLIIEKDLFLAKARDYGVTVLALDAGSFEPG